LKTEEMPVPPYVKSAVLLIVREAVSADELLILWFLAVSVLMLLVRPATV